VISWGFSRGVVGLGATACSDRFTLGDLARVPLLAVESAPTADVSGLTISAGPEEAEDAVVVGWIAADNAVMFPRPAAAGLTAGATTGSSTADGGDGAGSVAAFTAAAMVAVF